MAAIVNLEADSSSSEVEDVFQNAPPYTWGGGGGGGGVPEN